MLWPMLFRPLIYFTASPFNPQQDDAQSVPINVKRGKRGQAFLTSYIWLFCDYTFDATDNLTGHLFRKLDTELRIELR